MATSAEQTSEEVVLRICPSCKNGTAREMLRARDYVCPHCDTPLRIHAYRRLEWLVDAGSFQEWDAQMPFVNPLNFEGYDKKCAQNTERFHLNEAVVCGKCTIGGYETAIGVMDSRYMMASMGHIVGEKITRMFEQATKKKLPVILFCASGGARMQEGIISLMQMAKTSAAVKRHSEAGLLYVSVLTNPTTGGVTASFAMLGDVILAEPKAMIGFAGPRVIEETTHQTLPKGFQKAEFLLKHGFVDAVVPRDNQRKVLIRMLALQYKPVKGRLHLPHFSEKEMVYADSADMSAWDRVKTARMINRPTSLDYIEKIFPDFYELHGDRCFGDDAAIVGGIATFLKIPVMVIGEQKGKNSVEEAVFRNFGMPNPDGYRKALRLMKLAEKLKMPVINFVDTPGAYPGIEAEERGQGEAIARNMYEMSHMGIPMVSIIIGEGSSGGALALAVTDEVWILENAVYSILSPEGFASILYKDGSKAPEAAEKMHMLSSDLMKLGVVDAIIREYEPVTTEKMDDVVEQIQMRLVNFLYRYASKSASWLVDHRYDRFRKY